MVSSEPEITVHDRTNFNILFLACDGIWEGYTDYGDGVT